MTSHDVARRAAICLTALAWCLPIRTALAQDTPLAVDPYADLTDLYRLTYPMTGSTGQSSSYDRSGNNADAIFWYYHRAEPKRVVMADVRGPGCISRIWVTGYDAGVARIEIFIDGSSSPVVSAYMRDFFGNLAPFVPPLATASTGSWVSCVPIPFRKSCRIEAINARSDNLCIYYNVSYRQFPPGETLSDVFHMPPTSAQQTQLNLFAQQWNNRGQDPKSVQPGQQTISGSVYASSNGGTATVANLSGAGVVSGIRMTINPYIGDLLHNCRIRCRFDGSSSYAVDVPLGALCGSYFGPTNYLGQSAEVRALTFGNPGGQMYFYLPMPYSNGAVIDIANASYSGITVNYTVTYVPKTAGQVGRLRFHGAARSQHCSGGSPSYRILNTTGKGHFLGCVLGINFGDPNVGCLEGDELFHANGENYPSIHGTGTEDYFNAGYYFSGGPVSLPYSGCSLIEQSHYPLQMSAYRLSIPDAVVFRNGFIADIEHGGVNEGNGDYYSTAFYYRDDGPGSPPADPVNPPLTAGALVNGGFENGFGGYNNGEANGWMAYQSRQYYGNSLSTFSSATDQKFSGSTAQKVNITALSSANLSAGIAQQIQVARGSSYQVTAHLRLGLSGSLQTGNAVARLGLSTAGNTCFEDGSVVWTDAPTAANTWHTVSAIATAQSDFLTIFLGGQIKTSGIPGPATVWVDAVTIQPYTGPLPPPPLPVVDNPSFESGISPWSMWIGTGGNSDGLERDGVGLDGTFALAVKGIGSGGKGAWEFIGNNWVNGRQYRLSVSVRSLANSGLRYSIGHAIGNVGAAGVSSAVFGAEVTGTSAWQTVTDTFTFTGTDEGVTVYLRAVNAGASERAGFDRVLIEDVTPAGSPPSAPTGLTATAGNGQVSLTWNASAGATSYTVKRATVSGGPYGTIAGNLTTTAHTDTGLANGTTYYYVVSAVNAYGESANSGETIATPSGSPPGDLDGDGDVDQADFGILQSCLTGTGAPIFEPACTHASLDGDNDADEQDVDLFLGCISGPDVAADPGCIG